MISAQEFDIVNKTFELATSGQLEAAEASARDFLATPNISSQGRIHGLNTLAYVLYQKDNLPGALDAYKLLLEQNGVDQKTRRQTNYTMAQLYVVQEDYDNGLKYLTSYMDSVTPTAGNYVFLAQTYYGLERYTDMVAPLESAMALANESGTEIKKDWWTLLSFAGRKSQDSELIARADDALIDGWPSEKLVGAAVLSQLNLGDTQRMSAAMQRYAERYPDGEMVTPLQVATLSGDPESVHKLVKSGADINALGEINRTPLHLAANFGLASMVELLLSLGADTGAHNSNGASALWFAAEHGDPAIFEMIWKAGGDITYKPSETSVMQLMAVAGETETVSAILDAEPDLVDSQGDRALSLAASKGQSAVTRLLIERGASPDYRREDGPTTLQRAIVSGDLETVVAVLEAGVDPNETYDDRLSSLSIAAGRGHINILRALINAGADVEAVNSVGRNSLFIAAQNGHHEIIEVLRGKGVATDAVDTFGTSPLMAAAIDNHWQSISLLIDAEADVNREYSSGTTVLAVAAGAGKSDIMKALLDAGADPNGGKDRQTPMHLAIANNQAAAVTQLVAAGADTLGEAYKSSNALFYAAVAEYPDVVEALIDSGAVALEPVVFLEGWRTRDVTKLLKSNGFKRVGRGNVERWSSGGQDDVSVVELRKQKATYSIADIVRMVTASGIDMSVWIKAGRP
ncbi:MAG: ankyrin repeat domain-containing protein [Gammaproteobacteria bacterium]|nr:ankyrin repeat domain-containing protein [Gammaproteobacteria bacterium]